MATYIIGDVQGCFDALKRLLSAIGFEKGRDNVIFTGDLVNRGPESLATLRFIKENDGTMQTVLGNHDLHLLSAGEEKNFIYHKKDTIQEIITAPDKDQLLSWLRKQPLYLIHGNFIIVHAGIYPAWDLKEMKHNGDEITKILQGENYRNFLQDMYGDKPNYYNPELEGMPYLRFNLNVFTRMRALYRANKALNFTFKKPLDSLPFYLVPWFAFENPGLKGYQIVFGHWSAIGITRTDQVIALDTGVVWGGALSAYAVETDEIISVPA